ncbi:hypothetical protein THAOC_11990, partial [Thalassiosira oceanica]
MNLPPQPPAASGQKAGRSQGRPGEDGGPAESRQPSPSSPPVDFPSLPLEVARGWRPKRISPHAPADDKEDVEYLPQHLSPAARGSPGAFFVEDDGGDGERDEDEDDGDELGGTEHGVLGVDGRGDGMPFDEVDAVDLALHQYRWVRSLPPAAAGPVPSTTGPSTTGP